MSERSDRQTGKRRAAILIAAAILLIIIWTLLIFGQFLSRGVHFREHQYNIGEHTVTGRIAGAEIPGAYGVALFIKMDEASEEYYAMPSDMAVNPVNPDGTFAVAAYSEDQPDDMSAVYYSLLLVPAGLDIEELSNSGEPVWSILRRDYALDEVWDAKTGNVRD